MGVCSCSIGIYLEQAMVGQKSRKNKGVWLVKLINFMGKKREEPQFSASLLQTRYVKALGCALSVYKKRFGKF